MLPIPVIISATMLVVFLVYEFILTPFAIGGADDRDHNTRFLVLGTPIATGLITAYFLLAYKNYGSLGWWTFFGIIAMVAGIMLRVVSKRHLKDFRVSVTLKKSHKLVNSGPYKHILHPLYLGIILVFVSLPLLYGEWRTLVTFTLPSSIAIFHRIHVEEKALAQHFGIRWKDRKKKTWWFWS